VSLSIASSCVGSGAFSMHCTCNIVLAYKFHHYSGTTKSKVVAAHAMKVYEGVKVELHSLVTLAQERGEYSTGINI
jgi:hypothetical protein